MDFRDIALWGFLATLVMTAMEAVARGLGLTRMGLPFLVGTMFTGRRDRATILGFGAHFANGWLFAFLYGAVFEALGRATWWIGLALGALHALVILAVVLPLLPAVHPRMADEDHGPSPTRMLQPAGFFALHYGRRTALIVFAAHAVYGLILGAAYTPHGWR